MRKIITNIGNYNEMTPIYNEVEELQECQCCKREKDVDFMIFERWNCGYICLSCLGDMTTKKLVEIFTLDLKNDACQKELKRIVEFFNLN